MAAYTLKEKLFILKNFYQNGNSVEKVKNEFACEFTDTELPTNNIVVEIVKLFEEFGSVITKHEDKINCQSFHNSLENLDFVNNIISENINENEEYHLLRENDSIKIKTEPQPLFQTDVQDSPFHSDTENRIDTNENALIDDHLSPKIVSSDTGPKSKRTLNKSLTTVERLKLSDLKNKNYNDNELNSDISKITLTNVNSDNIAFEASQNTNPKSNSNVLKVDSVMRNEIFKCEECNKQFKSKRDYSLHIKHHKEPCEICGKKYGYLKQHMMRHALEPYKCNECDTGFVDKNALIAHLATHDDRPFQCDSCERTFKNSYHLKKHMQIHSIDHSFKCEICGKCFQNNLNLQLHVRRHTGEKPYVCSFCGKSFVGKSALVRHIRIHTGEKPYKCNVCDKQFNASGTLVMHKRIHTGEKPYKCKFCEKSFYDNATCKVHERTHTRFYQFKCALCGKAYIHSGNLRQHMKHTHCKNKDSI